MVTCGVVDVESPLGPGLRWGFGGFGQEWLTRPEGFSAWSWAGNRTLVSGVRSFASRGWIVCRGYVENWGVPGELGAGDFTGPWGLDRHPGRSSWQGVEGSGVLGPSGPQGEAGVSGLGWGFLAGPTGAHSREGAAASSASGGWHGFEVDQVVQLAGTSGGGGASSFAGVFLAYPGGFLAGRVLRLSLVADLLPRRPWVSHPSSPFWAGPGSGSSRGLGRTLFPQVTTTGAWRAVRCITGVIRTGAGAGSTTSGAMVHAWAGWGPWIGYPMAVGLYPSPLPPVPWMVERSTGLTSYAGAGPGGAGGQEGVGVPFITGTPQELVSQYGGGLEASGGSLAEGLRLEQASSLGASSSDGGGVGHSLADRTFKTVDFYRKHQNTLTPAGLGFFQSQWDESVTKTFHNTLDMKEPVFEFERPPVYHPPQVKFPHRQPLRYLDRYREGKEHTYGIY
ncbi:39S ribosomal protein L38, mitochondrial [Merluccius polli]|uniref:39S ribosomal protein L38, mitochondrial n=1 Tax=Merluccius polli TaxID=89951 RepID=A0AA47M650_MERPO|nr:39S ribosomal protein L38, mitochondrial [Merluccius polli]